MKRIIVCIFIIGAIIAVGVFSCVLVASKNDRLYGHIEAVISAYDGGKDVIPEISGLREFYESEYLPGLGYFVDDDNLTELSTMIARLEPMYSSDCDEFIADCAAIRESARRIYLKEVPVLFRIL